MGAAVRRSSAARSLTGQALILGILAGGLARLTATDAYLAYVRPSMRVPVVVSVLVLAVLALSSANRADRVGGGVAVDDVVGELEDDRDPVVLARAPTVPVGPDGPADDEVGDHGHHHHGAPRIGWLLLVPVLCIAVVPLRPLGADALSDRSANVVAEGRSGPSDLETELPEGGPVSMLAFAMRVINDPNRPFTEPVTLVGFVAEQPSVEDGFVLARFVISCCAADAQPILVHVVTDGPVPAPDTWVEVTGMQGTSTASLEPSERADAENIRLDAATVEEIPEPVEPYETF
jgi:uncharacterized repeat protein (TIGR03943 family)